MKKLFPWLLLLAVPAVLTLCFLAGPAGIGFPGESFRALRFNRVLTGFLVGAALATAGTVFQALLRNPLAEPYLLGVSSGAGLGAAIAILLIPTTAAWSFLLLPFSAFVFAGLTLLLVYSLAVNAGRVSIYGLILSGVIVSSICSSLLMALITFAPVEGLHTVIWWMLGNLDVTYRPLLVTGATLIVTCVIGAAFLAPELDALTLGNEMAHYVGVRTRRVVIVGLALATFVTATAVALAGLIGFVGLIVPHVVRVLSGAGHRRLIPLAAITGGLFLALCDSVARTVLRPEEIPVGVLTALLGGPFFLMILRRKRREHWIE